MYVLEWSVSLCSLTEPVVEVSFWLCIKFPLTYHSFIVHISFLFQEVCLMQLQGREIQGFYYTLIEMLLPQKCRTMTNATENTHADGYPQVKHHSKLYWLNDETSLCVVGLVTMRWLELNCMSFLARAYLVKSPVLLSVMWPT